MALTMTLGGIDVLPYVDFKTLLFQQSREVKGSTLNFDLRMYDTPIARPASGQEVIISDGSTREFAGVLVDLDRQPKEGLRLVRYICQCMDYSYYFDRRFLNKVYLRQDSDLIVSEVIDDLKAAADADRAEGDTHYNDFNTNDTLVGGVHTLATPIHPGPEVNQQRFERTLPSQAMDVIAEAAGMYWWIDFDKAINFQEISSRLAPLPAGVLSVEENNDDYFDLTHGESINGVGTKLIIRDSLTRSTATEHDHFEFNATTGNVKFSLTKRPFSEDDIVSVIINSGLPLTQILEDVGASPIAGEVGIYVGPRRGGVASYVRLVAADLVGGDIIHVIYNFSIIDDHESLDPERTGPMQDRTGGDGIHEFVFSQASEIAAVDPRVLDEISDIILNRKAQVLQRGQFSSLTKGWEAGQTFELRWPKEEINERVYVINLTKKVLTPADDPNILDNVIISTINYSNMPRGMRL